MLDPVINWTIAGGGALLFGTACVHKLRAPARFSVTLQNYRVVPRSLTSVVAFLVLVLEGSLAVGLLWPPYRELSCLAGAALLLIYALSMGINLARGRQRIDCGCSLRPRPIRGAMITRNATLAAFLLLACLSTDERPWVWTDGLTLAAAILVAAILYTSADMLLETQWPRW
jgi:hypothetical protein